MSVVEGLKIHVNGTYVLSVWFTLLIGCTCTNLALARGAKIFGMCLGGALPVSVALE